MNDEALRTFLSLEGRKKELETALNEVKKELDDARQSAIDALVQAGLAVGSPEGSGRELRIKRRASLSPLAGKDALIGAIKASSALSNFVKEDFDSRHLAGFVNEVFDGIQQRMMDEKPKRFWTEEEQMEALREALPEPLRAVVKIHFYYQLSSKKA